jgi:hypothetical protein
VVAAGLSGIRALVAGPVIAGGILAIGESGAIGLSAGEHFMPAGEPGVLRVFPVAVARIGEVVQTWHDLAFVRQPGELIQIVSLMGRFLINMELESVAAAIALLMNCTPEANK